MIAIYILLGLGILWILYMTINHFLKFKENPESLADELPTHLTPEVYKSSPQPDESARLENIENPDKGKPFAEISTTSSIETKVIQNVTTETQIVEIKDDGSRELIKKPRKNRKKRKPKTDENTSK
jgi:hypothetical protein